MKVLALDTSTEYCSVAVAIDDDVRTDSVHAIQRHSELLIPMIDRLLKATGLALEQFDGIAFGAGPGSFTGLRIACSVAQGLALGAGKRIVPVSTLLAMAEASGAARVIAALDARMREVYVAAYERRGAEWITVVEPGLYAPSAGPDVPGDGWTAVGNGFAVADGALAAGLRDQVSAVDVTVWPSAYAIARLAMPLFAQGLGVAPEEAVPLYVRDKVALKVSER